MIDVIKKQNVLILTVLETNINLYIVKGFKENLVKLIEDEPPFVILDYKNVEYVDSSGLGAMINISSRMKKYNGKLVLCNITSNVLTLFRMAKYDNYFTLFDSIDNALASFNEGTTS